MATKDRKERIPAKKIYLQHAFSVLVIFWCSKHHCIVDHICLYFMADGTPNLHETPQPHLFLEASLSSALPEDLGRVVSKWVSTLLKTSYGQVGSKSLKQDWQDKHHASKIGRFWRCSSAALAYFYVLPDFRGYVFFRAETISLHAENHHEIQSRTALWIIKIRRQIHEQLAAVILPNSLLSNQTQT